MMGRLCIRERWKEYVVEMLCGYRQYLATTPAASMTPSRQLQHLGGWDQSTVGQSSRKARAA